MELPSQIGHYKLNTATLDEAGKLLRGLLSCPCEIRSLGSAVPGSFCYRIAYLKGVLQHIERFYQMNRTDC
jgi:hypothetical protein